ncbi:nicotinate phosphoribosyltransferase [Roseomonas xinghualingensis]|uniref:nicotinate phosphoribosyltransferase n=1 Tax=Roseomonas xinghualingensis TaxID=2986475 RepID=UPI0021F1D451|nr:nicotinate phosphoribosyltransferase [Roseomonas sp. SXEYE001]MCV4206127.1 nicotinate phosphoribosyltransferase [Roseomonas sp. SXEYE001]
MIHNLAKRAHDRNWTLDPIIRSMLDDDWYKLAMLQFIWKHFRGTRVRFTVINRTHSVRLAEVMDEAELRAQLDHVRTLRFTRSELIWLAGNTFYGQRNIFQPAFLEWLSGLSLPPYRLSRLDGQFQLDFEGAWEEVTLWEIHALSILSELRTRRGYARLDEMDLDILFARAKARLWSKIERLAGVPGLKFADFGTRRRHSFLWQEYVLGLLAAKLPGSFTGTSNTYLAYKHNLEAIGTNAHELPMVLTALARLGRLGGTGLKGAQYEVLRLWQEMYGPAMRVMLPDTYGSTQFFRDAPDWAADWAGVRLDSKDPFTGGEEALAFFAAHGRDPREKLLIPSDGLNADRILQLHATFGGRIQPGYTAADFRDAKDFHDSRKWRHEPRCRISSGIGTKLTNDFAGCSPVEVPEFSSISLVCKVTEVEGHPAVKLSDNYTKATGPAGEIKHYRSVFGTEGVANIPVEV